MKRLYVAAAALLVAAGFANAESPSGSERSDSFNRSCELRTAMLRVPDYGTVYSAEITQSTGSAREKNQVLGIAMSALVPGSGQMYSGSWQKGVLFLGLEAVLWYGYTKFNREGKDLEDAFHFYADTHWDEERWRSLYNPNTDPSTHTLPGTKTQQYYEMIGKYDQFKQGWDDWEPDGPDLTVNREYYEGMRSDSNREFKNASYCAMVALANHLISAFDTGFTIRRYNRTIRGDVAVSMHKVCSETVPVVQATFSLK